MFKNTLTNYGSVAKFFHWGVALLIILMLMIGYIMINLSPSATRNSMYDLHKATGMLIFTLVVIRLFWRFINVRPGLSESLPRWQRYLADWTIVALYVLMFAMPITGFLTSTLSGHDVSFYQLFTIPALTDNKPWSEFAGETHEILSFLLVAVFMLHSLGSFYHHTVLRDNVFKRMWIR